MTRIDVGLKEFVQTITNMRFMKKNGVKTNQNINPKIKHRNQNKTSKG